MLLKHRRLLTSELFPSAKWKGSKQGVTHYNSLVASPSPYTHAHNHITQARISYFGLVGPHQHCIADTCRGNCRNPPRQVLALPWLWGPSARPKTAVHDFLIPEGVIWLCAYVRGWPRHGAGVMCDTLHYKPFVFHPHFKWNFIHDLIACENPLLLTAPPHQETYSFYMNYNIPACNSHTL